MPACRVRMKAPVQTVSTITRAIVLQATGIATVKQVCHRVSLLPLHKHGIKDILHRYI